MRYVIALAMVAMIAIISIGLFNGIQEIPVSQISEKAANPIIVAQDIQLSHNEYFYENTIQVAITTSNQEGNIYYTLDGSKPTAKSEKYTEPIEIKAENNTINTKALRAILVSNNIEIAEICHTYFVGKDVHSRFSTMVISLTTDPDNLYNYETGIFAEGKLRDDYVKANPGKEISPFDPANYNLRGRSQERPVYVEMFESNGKQVIDQNAGIRAYGRWSRSLEQKSIRLIARKEYEAGKSKFDYDFFANDYKFNQYHSPIQGYDSLVLKTAANSDGVPMLITGMASRLAQDSGFHEVLFVRPVAVYLNGEYYGFSFLQQLINEKSLQESYDAPEPKFDIVGESEISPDEGSPEAISDVETLNTYARKDLTNNETFKELSKLLDIDNFLHYYALELFFESSDWPHNNLKLWRYSGDTTVPNLPPELDGRWRYILFDLDISFGFNHYGGPMLDRLLGNSDRNSPLLKALLKRPDVAQQFLAILSELGNGVMAPEHVEKALNSLYVQSRQEVQVAKDAGKFSSSLIKDESILNFANKRWQELLPQVKKALGYAKTFDVTIKGISKRTYPLGSNVSILPELSRYEVFDGWRVNGVLNNQEKLNITQNDVKDGQVLLEQLSHVELPALQLIEVSEDRNRVILRNNTNKVISTKGFTLTDDSSDLKRWKFTPMKIQPGDTAAVVGKKILSNTVLFTPKLNFNIKVGETIILSNEFGQVLDYKVVE